MLTAYGTPVGVPGMVLVVALPLPAPPPHAHSPTSASRITEPKTRLSRRCFLKTAWVIKKSRQTAIGGSVRPSKPKNVLGVPAACGAVVSITSWVLPLPVIEEGLKLQLLRLPAGVITQEAGLKTIVPL